ncbi:hypothetical protein B8W99_25540 [Peribacillus simplex]|nr:hypothetical protein B8W99_25540 [Peribacillus simplex]
MDILFSSIYIILTVILIAIIVIFFYKLFSTTGSGFPWAIAVYGIILIFIFAFLLVINWSS